MAGVRYYDAREVMKWNGGAQYLAPPTPAVNDVETNKKR